MSNVFTYQKRSFQIPSGFALQPLPNNQYNDSQITQLFYMFLSCYSERINKLSTNEMKGCNAEIDCETKYLLMAIYILQNWYNESISFTFPLNQAGGGYDVSLLLVPSNGSEDESNPVFIDATGDTIAQIFASIQAMLPSNYSATLNGNFVTIIVSSSFPTLPYFWVAQVAYVGGGFNTWYPTTPYQSCIPYSAIETIIEKCLDICGCANCIPTESLTQDNYYVPLGQTLTIPESQINFTPIPFF